MAWLPVYSERNPVRKILCFLSGDLVTLLNRNSFDRQDVCNIYGNAKDVYTKKE